MYCYCVSLDEVNKMNGQFEFVSVRMFQTTATFPCSGPLNQDPVISVRSSHKLVLNEVPIIKTTWFVQQKIAALH